MTEKKLKAYKYDMTKDDVKIALTVARSSEWRQFSDMLMTLGECGQEVDYYAEKREWDEETRKLVEAIELNWKD